MRIAQICNYTAPAKDSMGAERIVERLSKGLVAHGHDVTMILAPDTEASPIPGARLAFDLNDVKYFDVLHFHGWDPEAYTHHAQQVPWVTTIHGYQLHQEQALAHNNPSVVAVSDFAGKLIGVDQHVWNCADADEFEYNETPGEYLLWLAGTDWGEGKGLFTTIALAKKMRFRLKIAGTGRISEIIDAVKEECNERIEYVGAVNGTAKVRLLQGARALILLTQLPDACPVTVSEALMCGTPVIGSNCGSMPEIVQDKHTGYICSSPLEALNAIANVRKISRQACRDYAQKHFSIDAAVNKYVSIYNRVIALKAKDQHQNAVLSAS